MSEIKRYDVWTSYLGSQHEDECGDGDYCLYSEVEALPKRIKELENQLEKITWERDEAEKKHSQSIIELQQKQEEIERLKANNSACIKEVIKAQKLADERLRHYSETTKQVICYRELMDRMVKPIQALEVFSTKGTDTYKIVTELLTDYQNLKK